MTFLRIFILLIIQLFPLLCSGEKGQKSEIEDTVILHTESGQISGTLLMPDSELPVPLLIIIAGSGPTDRNGNNPMMRNNGLKFLAEGLKQWGIASLRYDKRGIGASNNAGIREDSLRFEDYISDAAGWVKKFGNDERFNGIYIAGHSEGSLIGMIAARNTEISGFISIAGASEPADIILKKQLNSQPEAVRDYCFPIIDSLKAGITVDSIIFMYYSLFRPSVQPYLISWFKYDPQEEIKNLDIPVLLVQGDTDLQVPVENVRMLKNVSEKADLKIIQGMNHVLKKSETDRMKNLSTYNNPDLPVMPELIDCISSFIKSCN